MDNGMGMTEFLVPLLEGFLPSGVALAISMLAAMAVVVNFVLIITALLTWAERRIIGRIHNRIGPNRVGPNGLLQPIADAIKMMLKEDIVRPVADRWVFNLAPILLFIPAMAIFAVIPFANGWFLADLNIGILYVVAVSSFGSIAIFMAGWGSDSKYALIGAMRSVAMLVSYEVPMVLALASVVLVAGSMNMTDIVNAQSIPFILVQPTAFVIFLLAAAAEVGRTPFDLTEAESEIVAGYHTEYTGMKFGLFYLAEFLGALAWAGVGATVFLGGWTIPGIPFLSVLGAFWWLLKTLLLFSVFIWFRGTWPRLRIDQMLPFSWKVLFPIAGLNIIITAVEVLVFQSVFNVPDTGTFPALALAGMAVINIGAGLAIGVTLTNLLRPRAKELPPYPAYMGS
jgi:NADH-quinone oxidoreductase subunit H